MDNNNLYKEVEKNFYHFIYITFVDDNEGHWAWRRDAETLAMSGEDALKEAKNILDFYKKTPGDYRTYLKDNGVEIPIEYEELIDKLEELNEENDLSLEE